MGRSKPTRVVHFTSVHEPTDVRIFLKECRTLAKAGYEVSLIAPADREYMAEGVRIIPHSPSRGRFNRFTRTLFNVLRLTWHERADIYHFHDPELMLVGLVLKLDGRRVVYDAHEGYKDAIFDKEWIPRPLRWLIANVTGMFESFVASYFDAVVAATPYIGSHFSPGKAFVVENFPLLNELSTPEDIPFSERPPGFAYAGVLSRIRAAVEMVEATGKAINPQTRLHMAGPEPARGLADMLADTSGWERIILHGWLSRPQIAALYSRVLAGLVVFYPIRNHVNALPNKLFEYMSAGLPLIVSDFSSWRRMIELHRCGLLVDPLDPSTIAAAMDWMDGNREEAAAMGARGRKAVLESFNWDRAADQLLACYEKVLS